MPSTHTNSHSHVEEWHAGRSLSPAEVVRARAELAADMLQLLLCDPAQSPTLAALDRHTLEKARRLVHELARRKGAP